MILWRLPCSTCLTTLKFGLCVHWHEYTYIVWAHWCMSCYSPVTVSNKIVTPLLFGLGCLNRRSSDRVRTKTKIIGDGKDFDSAFVHFQSKNSPTLNSKVCTSVQFCPTASNFVGWKSPMPMRWESTGRTGILWCQLNGNPHFALKFLFWDFHKPTDDLIEIDREVQTGFDRIVWLYLQLLGWHVSS